MLCRTQSTRLGYNPTELLLLTDLVHNSDQQSHDKDDTFNLAACIVLTRLHSCLTLTVCVMTEREAELARTIVESFGLPDNHPVFVINLSSDPIPPPSKPRVIFVGCPVHGVPAEHLPDFEAALHVVYQGEFCSSLYNFGLTDENLRDQVFGTVLGWDKEAELQRPGCDADWTQDFVQEQVAIMETHHSKTVLTGGPGGSSDVRLNSEVLRGIEYLPCNAESLLLETTARWDLGRVLTTSFPIPAPDAPNYSNCCRIARGLYERGEARDVDGSNLVAAKAVSEALGIPCADFASLFVPLAKLEMSTMAQGLELDGVETERLIGKIAQVWCGRAVALSSAIVIGQSPELLHIFNRGTALDMTAAQNEARVDKIHELARQWATQPPTAASAGEIFQPYQAVQKGLVQLLIRASDLGGCTPVYDSKFAVMVYCCMQHSGNLEDLNDYKIMDAPTASSQLGHLFSLFS